MKLLPSVFLIPDTRKRRKVSPEIYATTDQPYDEKHNSQAENGTNPIHDLV